MLRVVAAGNATVTPARVTGADAFNGEQMYKYDHFLCVPLHDKD